MKRGEKAREEKGGVGLERAVLPQQFIIRMQFFWEELKSDGMVS
jgi:hypothetical protein